MSNKEIHNDSIKRPIPRKLNDGMIRALEEAVGRGNYIDTAASLCGIERHTLYNWLKQGELDAKEGVESCYYTLITALKRAESKAEDELVQVVRESATTKKEWLPAITFLERRHPDRWGRRERKHIDINETKTVKITHVEVVHNNEIIEGEGRELLESGRD